MTAFGLFMVGLFTGMAAVIGIGIVDGIFGERALSAAMVASLGVYLMILLTQGIESTAQSYGPWQYWLGLVVGCILGTSTAVRLKNDLQRGGVPLVIYYGRSITND